MANLGSKATSSPAGLGFGGRPIGTISEVKSSQEIQNPYYVAPQKYMVDSSSPAQKEEREHGNYLQRNIEMLKGGYRTPTFDDSADMGKPVYARRQTGGTVFEDEQGANPFGEGHRSLRWGNLPFTNAINAAQNEYRMARDQYKNAGKVLMARKATSSQQVGDEYAELDRAEARWSSADAALKSAQASNTNLYPMSAEQQAKVQKDKDDAKEAQDDEEKKQRDQANSPTTAADRAAQTANEQEAQQRVWNATRSNPLGEGVTDQTRKDVKSIQDAQRARLFEITQQNRNSTLEQERAKTEYNKLNVLPAELQSVAPQLVPGAQTDNPGGGNPSLPNLSRTLTTRVLESIKSSLPLGKGGFGGNTQSIFNTAPWETGR